ncbi:MAG: hypothetical protein JRH20_21180 [Deltaproteobacteria bacterium]|nr:hypothetical protein [Deltaproteobacteria bacterium]
MGESLYVGRKADLQRFNIASGEHTMLPGPKGEPLREVSALSGSTVGGLWVVAKGHLYQRQKDAWVDVPAGAPPRPRTVLAMDDGVLVGGEAGLARLAKGSWRRMLPGAKVTSLAEHRSRSEVWVGTTQEGVYSLDSAGKLTSHSAARGQPVRRVQSLAVLAGGGVLVLGRDARGRQLLSHFNGEAWTRYWPSSERRLRRLFTAGQRIFLQHRKGLFELRQTPPVKAGEKSPFSLLQLTVERAPGAQGGHTPPHFVAVDAERELPRGITIVASSGGYAYLGTVALGVARFDGRDLRWFRTVELMGGQERLLVGCGEEDCFFIGGGQIYRYVEGQLRALTLPQKRSAIAVFRQSNGRVAVVLQGADPNTLALARVKDGKLSVERELAVRVPRGPAVARFSRQDPQGRTWLGLAYRDEEKEERPWGVAVITVDGKATFHRSSMLPKEKRPADSLALPDDIRDVSFKDGDLWMATGVGVCHVVGKKVREITENDGLVSELTYAINISPKGEILLGSYGGLGRFDGKEWRFESSPPLSGSVRALVRQRGVLWAGTLSGLIRSQGTKIQIFSTRDGLAGSRVLDLHLDGKGRLWVLSKLGLTVASLD